MQPLQLPSDAVSQRFVSVSAIPAGFMYLPDREVFEDSLDKDTGRKVPSFSFLIEHGEHAKILFDLGTRKHGMGYPPALRETLETFVIDCDRDVVDLLKEGGLGPEDIQVVIYSHLHFDHVGDLNPFSSAQLVLGGDAAECMTSSYPQDPKSYFQEFPKGQKVQYLDFSSAETNSIPLGPFHRAVDFFHDGSFYVIDAQGHFPGHLAALARTGPNQFVLLAGDCCHHRLCYNPGERLISSENYDDIHLARETVNHVKAMHEVGNVVVLLSHEKERLDEMPLFPQKLNKWAEEEMETKRVKV